MNISCASVPSKKRKLEDKHQETKTRDNKRTSVINRKSNECSANDQLMKKMSEAMMIMLQQSFMDVRMKIQMER